MRGPEIKTRTLYDGVGNPLRAVVIVSGAISGKHAAPLAILIQITADRLTKRAVAPFFSLIFAGMSHLAVKNP